MRLKVKLAHFDDAVGYDIEITHINATIQDYLDGLNHFQENYVESCKGCDGCCYERIPLTSIDVLKYLEDPDIASQLKNNSYPPFLFYRKFLSCVRFRTGSGHQLKKSGPVLHIPEPKGKNLQNPQIKVLCLPIFYMPSPYRRAGQLRDVLLNAGRMIWCIVICKRQKKGAACYSWK